MVGRPGGGWAGWPAPGTGKQGPRRPREGAGQLGRGRLPGANESSPRRNEAAIFLLFFFSSFSSS